MLKTVICAALFLFCLTPVFGLELDIMRLFTPEVMELRNTREGTLKMLEILKSEYATNTNSYNACIKLSLAYYYLGNFFEKKKEAKLDAFAKCRDFARAAVAIDPEDAAGHYWLGVAVGIWSDVNGILDSLFNAETVLREMNAVIQSQPDYFLGLPWAIRAKVYYYVPGFLFGNKEKAWSDISNAVKYGPNLRMNWEYYTELLMKENRWKDAEVTVKHGIDIPIDPKLALEDNYSLDFLTNYQRIIRENIRK
jgi:tetratricopeptide (TPR) repeat protein